MLIPDPVKPKKLMFIAPSAYPLGGVQVWLDYLLPGLVARNWQVHLGLVAGKFHMPEKYLQKHQSLNNIMIKKIMSYTGTQEGRIRAVQAAISEVSPDIVVGVNVADTYPAIRRIRKAKNSSFCKVVMTNHGIQPDYYEDAFTFKNTLDAVISTNHLAQELTSEITTIPKVRSLYAPYGVEATKAIDFKQRKRTGKSLRILYAGRFDQFQKRMHDIPKILKNLDTNNIDFEMFFAGNGPEENILRDSLEHHGLMSRTTFLGTQSRDAMLERIYPETDILLLTSSWETGPIVIWEAMSHGVTVASSRYVGSGLEGSLQHEENCLLFDVGDIASAASCLSRLKDPTLRQRLGEAGRDMVARRYSEAISIDTWGRCLATVMTLPKLPISVDCWTPPPTGRLDRWLGPTLAENLRRCLGRRFEHRSAGDEWPHSYGKRATDDPDFWRMAASLDGNSCPLP